MVENIVAIIPARGGSIGIPNKNILDFCGKPLIAWSILQAKKSKYINSIWVTSDSYEILEIAEKFGANAILRPKSISGSKSSSESAWIHAYDQIKENNKIDLIVGMQATSPIREVADIDAAIKKTIDEKYDSMLTVSQLEDYFIWKKEAHSFISENYDYKKREMRQDIQKKYLENGSFYIFTPELLKQDKCRLGGKIGIYQMAKYKSFQLDEIDDLKLCEIVMRGYGIDKDVV